MDETALIEDIISTKNTLTILQKALIANQNSLQPSLPTLDLIKELLNILTHSSVKQLRTALPSTESKSIFNELKDTLNELSDAVTTNNVSVVNKLNEQLSSFIQKIRIRSFDTTNNEQTADDIFKENLLQSNNNTKPTIDSEFSESDLNIPIPQAENDDLSNIPEEAEKKKKSLISSAVDPFAHFRFARRRRVSSSSEENDESVKPASSRPPRAPARAPSLSPLKPITHVPINDSNDSHPSKQSSNKPRLMISYNHASKPICVNIHKSLTDDGYVVWIDLEEMHGSTLVAMAQAIDESDIILYCVTENYSQSRNCQKEAEYAFVQQKIMIPLVLQANYKPKGWLGLLMGASLYIDFTKNEFSQNYTKLKKEIELNTTRIDNNQNDVPKLTFDSTTNEQEQTHKEPDKPLLQSPRTVSTTNVAQSRGCVLF